MTVEPSDKSPTENEQSSLRRVFEQADYATLEMEPSHSGDHHEDVMTIRKIRAATMLPPGYPRSRLRKLNADPAALASWENEGGSVRRDKRHSTAIARNTAGVRAPYRQ